MVLGFQRDHQKEKEVESPKEIIARKENRKEKVSPPKVMKVKLNGTTEEWDPEESWWWNDNDW